MSGFGHVKLAPHFELREFRCHGTHCACSGAFKAEESLVALLEQIRSVYGPVQVTCGFRCTVHNKDVGGFVNSYHIQGCAADITNVHMRADLKRVAFEIGEFIQDFAGEGKGNVIYYPTRNFIHVDVGTRTWTTLVREKK